MAIRISAPVDSGQNRLWGIPWLGILARAILCIPQVLLLWLLGLAFWLACFVSWAPILLNGRQATTVTGIFRSIAEIQARTTLFIALATGTYPGFFEGSDHPILVVVDEDDGQNRLWGIPFVGIIVRAILVIPHAIVLWALGLGAGLLVLVSWIPVLVNGRQADPIVSYLAGVYRYGLRVAAYVTLVTGQYPPFRLAD